ncbi:hypothetical protein CLUG_00188 [Clavispora lusitaniae ATCC 42720]|uniref:Uncharacterized protein n=1 Tax=Clavispora lusitaniae (strain ATCC 42720) TaxID=306902 RepID=C4XW65_CLAL4|nr:uncharacterized protein CLUG_00188 [Clavispora lusitaniae ATCC 42720]EEQ36064.1 hypothetical protein CLUG_00188 [Clavispora lusitaniae ATCC 42720]
MHVVTQVGFGAHKQNQNVLGRVMQHFGNPLRLDISEGSRADDGKTAQEDFCLRIRQRAQTVVLGSARSVPKPKFYGLTIDHNRSRVVVENSGDVIIGESVGGVRDQETGFAYSSVANDNGFYASHGGLEESEFARPVNSPITRKKPHEKACDTAPARKMHTAGRERLKHRTMKLRQETR